MLTSNSALKFIFWNVLSIQIMWFVAIVSKGGRKEKHTDKTYSPFMCSALVVGQVDAVITILTTASYTVGRSEENMFLKFIFSSSLGDAIKSHHDLFLFLKTYPRIMPHFKKSLKVLIHIRYMIGPSILRVSEGRSDSFTGWQVCLSYCYCITKLCNAVFFYPAMLIALYHDRRPVQKIANTIKAALDRMWPLLTCSW